jgi:hypothetical protein
MSLLATFRRPAVRVPLVLLAVLGCSLWAVRACRDQSRRLDLAQRRHVGFIRLLAAAAAERSEPPTALGELVWPAAAGAPPALHLVFLRDFAGLPEWRELVPPETAPLDRLGEVRVWTGSGERGREPEILWAGTLFRIYRAPGPSREFVIFSWPAEPGAGGVATAWLSNQPDRIYYTAAAAHRGPERGPKPEDLGEDIFAGRLNLLVPGTPPQGSGNAPSPLAEGRVWAWQDLAPLQTSGSVPAGAADR